MQQRRGLIASIVFVAAAFAAGAGVQMYRRSSAPLAIEKGLPLASVGVSREAAPPFEPARWPHVVVSRIIDGDTVVLDTGESVRLIGIDAPERGSCYAQESADYLASIVVGRTLQLEPGVRQYDTYGRKLGYLRDATNLINLMLVEQGAAVASPYAPNTLYAAQFAIAEQGARAARRGLWGACGGLDPRRETADLATDVAPEGCPIKGNISSSGEKIYHAPDCASYEQTRIDETQGEQWFCSEEAAVAAGWRKAENCP